MSTIVTKQSFQMVSLLTVSKAENPAPGRYIVTLKEDVSLAAHVSSTQANIASTASNITHEFNLIDGYAGEFTDEDLNDLRSHPDIASIEQDSLGWFCNETIQSALPPTYPEQAVRFPSDLDRTNATWGLWRISSKEKLTGNDLDLKSKYKFYSSAGKGVNVYVIGISLSLTI